MSLIHVPGPLQFICVEIWPVRKLFPAPTDKSCALSIQMDSGASYKVNPNRYGSNILERY